MLNIEVNVFYVEYQTLNKSEPHLRLKNSKRTSKCQVFFSTAPKKTFEKVPQCQKTERGDPLGFFNMHSFGGKKLLKKSQCRKN